MATNRVSFVKLPRFCAKPFHETPEVYNGVQVRSYRWLFQCANSKALKQRFHTASSVNRAPVMLVHETSILERPIQDIRKQFSLYYKRVCGGWKVPIDKNQWSKSFPGHGGLDTHRASATGKDRLRVLRWIPGEEGNAGLVTQIYKNDNDT